MKKTNSKAAKVDDSKWKIATVGIDEIVKTEVNANRMSEVEFAQLMENVKRSGLSSVLACYKRASDGKYVIISGNHRYMVMEKLGHTTLNIIYADEADLSKDEIIATQLSHNSLHGHDDRSVLAGLLKEIDSIDFKQFAFIDIDALPNEETFSASIVPISEHYSLNLILYREDLTLMDELMDMVDEGVATHDVVLLAAGGLEAPFLDMLHETKKQYKIKATAVAFSKILEMAKKQMENPHG